MTETVKTRVALFPIDKNLDLTKEYQIIDHVNLSGSSPREVGFIPVTDIYSAKSNEQDKLHIIKVAHLKQGEVPDPTQCEFLLKHNIQAYTYELLPQAFYDAAAGKLIDARGYFLVSPRQV
jgi:hypothetical protein